MEQARILLLLLVLVPAVVLLAQDSGDVGGQEVRPTGATPDHGDDGDSAPFMVVVEREDGSRCGGSLVSARTVLTSTHCSQHNVNAVWVRAQPGPVRRVFRLVVSTGSVVNLALLELEMSLGPPARAILIASVSRECAPPAACHVVCARSRRLRIVDEQLVSADTCAALIPHSLDGALCLTGAPLCPSDSGAGVVCAGKLCGVIGDSDVDDSPAGTGCGSPRVAAALPRHRRFLQCAHRPAACTRDAECEHICTETQLLDEESERHSPPAPQVAPPVAPPVALPLAPRAISTVSLPPRTSSAAGDASWVVLSAESAVPASSPRGPGVPATRTAPAVAPSRSSRTAPGTDVPASGDTRTRSALEFEPNRADFKPGEYGDNAAEYAAEEPLSSAAPLPLTHAPTTPAAPAPGPGRAAAELAARVSPAEMVPARASCGTLCPSAPVPVSVALLLLLTL